MSARNDATERGAFVALEGLDGSGKSSQIRLLSKRLRDRGLPVHETREPTSGPIGSVIHQMMTGRIAPNDPTIAALFVADRLDHLSNPIDGMAKLVSRGVNVLTDRYYFSSYAYHSLHVPLEWVIAANSLCAEILRPDVSVFLDVPVSECVRRIHLERLHLELYETEETMVHVRRRYLEAFETLSGEENVEIVDGSGSEEEVAERLWTAISPLLGAG